MTIVAVTVSHGWPVLFGDIVVSSKSPMRTDALPVPSLDDQHSALTINRLVQKVHLFSPHLAVGFAGDGWSAKIVAEELRTHFSDGPINFAALQQCLAAIPETRNVSFVGLCVTDADTLQVLNWQAAEIEYKGGTYLVAGSGGDVIRELLDLCPSPEFSIPMSTIAQKHGASVAHAGMIATLAIAEELLGDNHLEKGFGGGYQMVIPFRDGLCHFTDWEMFFWLADENSAGESRLTFQPYFFWQYYYQDHLFIVRTDRFPRLDTGFSLTPRSFKYHAFIIPSLLADSYSGPDFSEAEISKSLDYAMAENRRAALRLQTHVVFTKTTEIKVYGAMIGTNDPVDDYLHHFSNEDGRTQLNFGRKLLGALREMCFPGQGVVLENLGISLEGMGISMDDFVAQDGTADPSGK